MNRQNHVLQTCSNLVINYLYDAEKNIIYKLNSNLKLEKVGFMEFVDSIPENYIDDNILCKITPSDLIISPYNEAYKFLNNKYFLTDQQSNIVNQLYNSNKIYNCIEGAAGTGKSLILFDLAKKYIMNNKSVALVFCGILDNDEVLSQLYGFDIYPIKKIAQKSFESLENYDLVLFDEFQRIRSDQYDLIRNVKFRKVVFSVDQQQTIHKDEVNREIIKELIETYRLEPLKLDKKIRQDKKMSNFILKFLNAKTGDINPDNYENVNVVYFSNNDEAIPYIDFMMSKNDYTIIELTEYKTTSGIKQRESLGIDSKNIHEVIGREYDNVIAIIDKFITFDENANLSSDYYLSDGYRNYPYDEYNSYFEALTRVRENLELVVIGNEEIYLRILEILNWHKDCYVDLNDKVSKLSKENKKLEKQILELKNNNKS